VLEKKPQDVMDDESISDKEKVKALEYMILRYHGDPEADEAVRLIDQIQSR
jgi:hypothetical protein